MARSNKCWLWKTTSLITLYVQVADGTDDLDQVVFKWRNAEPASAYLRSTGELLTDCELILLDQQSCSVNISGEQIDFKWEEPTQDRPGLIAMGVPVTQKSTTWADRKQRFIDEK